MKRLFGNHKGNIAILILFLVAGLALVGAGFYFFLPSGAKTAKARDPKDILAEYREQLIQAIRNPPAQQATLERNPNAFACLYTVQADCNGKGGLVQLFETANGASLTQMVQGEGLTLEGASCRNFPSKDCPVRVELQWKPVCAPGVCMNTKSMLLQPYVRIDTGEKDFSPLEWRASELVSPEIRLSPTVACERTGGVYSGGACLTKDQAERRIASSGKERVAPVEIRDNSAGPLALPREQQEVPPGYRPTPRFQCPSTIVVQGQEFTVELLSEGDGQVHVPAVNGCPAYDTFVFRCSGANPSLREGEGAWVQTQAVMAPPCDESGHPIGAASGWGRSVEGETN